MKCALYVGSGLDILPVKMFPSITKWIYVDQIPSYFYSDDTSHEPNATVHQTKFFISECSKIFAQQQFYAESYELQSPLILYNSDHTKSIKYYYNTCMGLTPFSSQLIEDCKTVDTLVVIGHCPHIKVWELIPKNNLNFIGSDTTVYSSEKGEDLEDHQITHWSNVHTLKQKCTTFYLLESSKTPMKVKRVTSFEHFETLHSNL
jgi:hypothetical protein